MKFRSDITWVQIEIEARKNIKKNNISSLKYVNTKKNVHFREAVSAAILVEITFGIKFARARERGEGRLDKWVRAE